MEDQISYQVVAIWIILLGFRFSFFQYFLSNYLVIKVWFYKPFYITPIYTFYSKNTESMSFSGGNLFSRILEFFFFINCLATLTDLSLGKFILVYPKVIMMSTISLKNLSENFNYQNYLKDTQFPSFGCGYIIL